MIAWVIKMLLKLMKPFAKIMIWEAIFESLSGAVGDTDEEPSDEDTSNDGE